MKGGTNKMAILCDICKTNVTPNEMYGGISSYVFLKIQGHKYCLCIDCNSAIAEWIGSDKCKKHCLEFSKQFEKNGI